MSIILNHIYQGHTPVIMAGFPKQVFSCIVTSPPYFGLRAYGTDPQIWFNGWKGELGAEPARELYIEHLMEVFDQCKRTLRDDGLLFVNIADSYATQPAGNKYPSGFQQKSQAGKSGGLAQYKNEMKRPDFGIPAKSLCHIPELFVLAMEQRGWIHRSTIIWVKGMSFARTQCGTCKRETRYSGSCMPDSATSRPNKNGFEYVYMFSKSAKTLYWYNEHTGKMVKKRPAGIKGIEGKSWRWIEHTRCKGQGCDNKRCVNGRVKSSYWHGLDGFYEQQFEESCYDGRKDTIHKGGKKYGTGRNIGPQGPQQMARQPMERWPNPAGRTIRNVWAINPRPFHGAHFATFSPQLVEIILAMAVPKEICSKCGLPRVKIYRKNKIVRERPNPSTEPCQERGPSPNDYAGSKITDIILSDCRCRAEFVPGVVFDPFGGAGTTGLVANQMGLSWVLCELLPKYVEISKQRIGC